MQVMCFHLMPYAALDLTKVADDECLWVTYPNSNYDPKEGSKLYKRYLDELEYGAQCGFHAIGVNEHHQTAFGLMPTPGVLAGALTQRNLGNAKLGVIGRGLPLLENPLAVAEEYAVIDNLTEGKLIAGFVRGIGAEYHTSGVNPAESLDRFHEAHDLILQSWTEEGPSQFHGKYYSHRYVNVWPRPYQKPHPDIWIPSQGSTETIMWAAHPSRKYTYYQTLALAKVIDKYLGMYKSVAKEYGYEASPNQLGWSVPVYVSDTNETAINEARPHIEAFINKFLKMPVERLLPAGYTSIASLKGLINARKATTLGGYQTIETLMKNQMFICGSPDQVTKFFKKRSKELGIGHLSATMHFGTLPHELTMRSIELFGKQVLPHIV